MDSRKIQVRFPAALSMKLRFWGCLGLGIFLSLAAQAQERVFRLYHSHSHEFLEVAYEKNGEIDSAVLRKLNHFLRSRDESGEKQVNLDLIRLLGQIQDHFGADTLEVICGYRSAAFNGDLKKEGHAVAENSYHIRGMAADIHLDDINEKTLFDYVRSLKKGGAGYYPDVLMVHVDVGPVRTWQDGTFTDRRTIGEFTDVPGSITTDHLFYKSGNRQKLTFSGGSGVTFTDKMALDWFHRGEWQEIPNPPHVQKGVVVLDSKQLPYGKFRWKVHTVDGLPSGKIRWKDEKIDGRFQFSNEFYLKKM